MDNFQAVSTLSTCDQIQEANQAPWPDPQRLIQLLQQAYQAYDMPPYQFWEFSSQELMKFSAGRLEMAMRARLEQLSQNLRQSTAMFENMDVSMEEREGNQRRRSISSQLPKITEQSGGANVQHITVEEQQEARHVSQNHQNFQQIQQQVLERSDQLERQTQPITLARRRNIAQFLPKGQLDIIVERNNEISERKATDPSIFEGEKSRMTFSSGSASSPQNSPERNPKLKPTEKPNFSRVALNSIVEEKSKLPTSKIEEASEYKRHKPSAPVSARQGESKEEEIVSARQQEVKEKVQSKMEKKSGL